jgi:hypothetical protein
MAVEEVSAGIIMNDPFSSSRAAKGSNGSSAMVKIKYDKGDTKFDTIKVGVKYVVNGDPLLDVPDELNGLTFARRALNNNSDATIEAPAGTTVYILLGDGPRAVKSCDFVSSSGWNRIADAHVGPNSGTIRVYKRVFTEDAKVTIPGGGGIGVGIAAKNLVLTTEN